MRRVIAKTHLKLAKLKIGSQSWSDQFVQAMNVNGGEIEDAKASDYIMHFLTFGFKVRLVFELNSLSMDQMRCLIEFHTIC